MESENVINVTICKDDKTSHIYQLDKDKPLDVCIADVCRTWKIPDPHNHLLAILKSTDDETKCEYVNEENKFQLKNSCTLQLYPTPASMAEKLVSELQNNQPKLSATLTTILVFIEDPVFCSEMIKKNCVKIISQILATSSDLKPDCVHKILNCLLQLLENYKENMLDISEPAIIKIIQIINNYADQSAKNQMVIIHSLNLLEFVTNYFSVLQNLVLKNVHYEVVVNLVKCSTVDIQQAALSFILTSFQVFPLQRKLNSASIEFTNLRNILYSLVKCDDPLDFSLTSHVRESQKIFCFSFIFYHRKNMIKTPDLCSKIVDILVRNLENINSKFKGDDIISFKRLGLTVESDRSITLSPNINIQSGLLVFHFLSYMMEKFSSEFVTAFILTKQKPLTFLPIIDSACRILSELFLLSEKDELKGFDKLYPLIFSTSDIMETLFVHLFQHFVKITTSCSLSVSDIEIALKGKIEGHLSTSIVDVPQFITLLNNFASPEMFAASITATTSNVARFETYKPVVELKEMISLRTKTLLDMHRIKFMQRGSLFYTTVYRGKLSRPICLVLSDDKQFIHYGYCDVVQPYSRFVDKISVNSFKAYSNSPEGHPPEKNRDYIKYVDCMFYAKLNDEFVRMIAENSDSKRYWLEGLEVITNVPTKSDGYEKDLKMFVNTFSDLLLVDLHSVPLPNEPFTIPPPPADYDYFYKIKTEL